MVNKNHGGLNGDQFSSSIIRRAQRKQTDGNNAESESKDPDDGLPTNKPQVQASVIKSNKTNYQEKEQGM